MATNSSYMVANTNHTALLKNQHALNYLSYIHFLSNFGCKIIYCALSIFGISKIPTHCLKEVLVTWRLSTNCSGLLDQNHNRSRMKTFICTHVVNNYQTPHHHCRILNPILRTLSIKARISTCPLTCVFLLNSVGLIFFAVKGTGYFSATNCYQLISMSK